MAMGSRFWMWAPGRQGPRRPPGLLSRRGATRKLLASLGPDPDLHDAAGGTLDAPCHLGRSVKVQDTSVTGPLGSCYRLGTVRSWDEPAGSAPNARSILRAPSGHHRRG